MTIVIRCCLILALVAASSRLTAQSAPAVHPLGPILATSTEPLGAVSQVRALPNGRVIVHDNAGRRVILFDSTLKHFTVMADAAGTSGIRYLSRIGGLIAYRGDSTLFIDPTTYSMTVIDPDGRMVRTMTVPLPSDVQGLIGGPFGTPGFDARGRMVFRAQIRMPLPAGGATAGFRLPPQPDSSLIVRFDFGTRKLDTLATFRIPLVTLSMTAAENGALVVMTVVNPMPQTDDWAVLSDGTVAIVRGREYRVDFVESDGLIRSAPKLNFEWQRLSDLDKIAVIDSTRREMDRLRAQRVAKAAASTPAGASIPAPSTGAAGRQRPQSDEITSIRIVKVGADGPDAAMPPLDYVPPSELPDYRPPFRQGAAHGDADGNLWIRTSKVFKGGTVYDVINNKGALIDRVQAPPGRVIAGFGPGGMVYMGVVDGDMTRLERARVH